MRSDQELNRAIELYGDTVRRLCMVNLKNYHDSEDVFQNVFLKYALSSVVFEGPEHEKAWFIRVTVNACRDLLRSFFHSRTVTLDELYELSAPADDESRQVLEAVLSLPQKYRDAVYLHWYEGYSAPDIGKLLGKNVNSVYTLLTRSKKLLRDALGGEDSE